ncbi:hypothetical protein FRC10_012076 [Ceratobasidium sp. 414]|nr:hypothetical protein FRC10_012076 [Ceratobasidium sp. 414]
MSRTEHSGTAANGFPSIYAPLLTEIHTMIDALATNHSQITVCQATRTQQSLRNAATWHAQHKRMFGQYFANKDRLSRPNLAVAMSMDASLDNLGKQLEQADERLLKHEMGMAQRQAEVCGRLMETVSKMMEKLRADEERYWAEREERREEEEVAWQVGVEEKNRSIRAWINNSAVVEVEGEGSTDEEMAFWD